MDASADSLACQLMDVAPAIMRTIRSEMRSHQPFELSVPLFRSLTFLDRRPGVSLLDLAGHLGLTSPTAFKIVERLVGQGLVERADSPRDRRRVTLTLTPAGKKLLEDAHSQTQARLAGILSGLAADERRTVSQALALLQPLFIDTKIGNGENKK